MAISIQADAFDLGTTPIENIFLEEFMPYASAQELKVYLFGYKLVLEGKNPTLQDLATRLDLTLQDVQQAYEAWRQLGLVAQEGQDILYRSLRGIYLESNYEMKKGRISPEFNSWFRELFARIDHLLALPLSEPEKQELASFIEGRTIDSDLIVMAFEETRTARLRVRRASERLRYWLEHGAETVEEVLALKERLNLRQKAYRDILSALGNPYDQPSSGDRECIDCWLDEMGFAMEDILEKIRVITRNKRNPSMNYLDAAFRNEHEKKNPPPRDQAEQTSTREEELLKRFRRRE